MSIETVSDTQQQAELPVSVPDMTQALRISMVPFLYENLYGDTDCYNTVETFDPSYGENGQTITERVKKGEGSCSEIKTDEATQSLKEALQKTSSLKEADVSIVNVDGTTAALIYDPEKHSMMVTFATTQTVGDIIDSVIRCSSTETSLGGKAHNGFYDDLREPQDRDDFPAKNLVELMEGIIMDRAARHDDKPLTVDFSGFCSGGAKSALAVGEMLHDGLFCDPTDIQLGNVYTFSATGYVDEELKSKLENSIEEAGGNLLRIQLHGDSYSDLMTSHGPWLARPMDYKQPGTHVYLVPGQDGQEPKVMVNPSREEIDALPEAEVSGVSAHWPTPYERTLLDIEKATAEPSVGPKEEFEVPNRFNPAHMLTGL